MNDTFLAANLQSIQIYYPDLVSLLPQHLKNVNLHPREDGFFYAECRTPDGRYFISREESISADLFAFRREIREAVQQDTDLFFLLGVGLGYRLKAVWETLQVLKRGYLVVLEESPEIFSAACRASDLRAVFSTPGCQLIISPFLQSQITEMIQKRSWFGTKKCRWYWGYQVTEKGHQPRYDRLADHITHLLPEMQNDFVHRWQAWVKTKSPSNQPPIRAALIYETAVNQPFAILQKVFDKARIEYPEVITIEIPKSQYISQTFLMQRILETNPDILLWNNLPPGTWLPPEVYAGLPIHGRPWNL